MAFPTDTSRLWVWAWVRWLCEAACTLVALILCFIAVLVPLYPYADLEEPLASQADTDTAAGIVFLSVSGIGLLLMAELLAWWGSFEPRVHLQRGLRLALFALFAWQLFQAVPHVNG